MWVLSTDRAELHFFPSPESIEYNYAALSHTWNNQPEDGPPEQSFQEVQKIREDCKKDGRNPRDVVSEKIRKCCELAEKHGHKWVWIDTCCIDKTSSAELSETINSMFRIYALAAICYGYLRDVHVVFDPWQYRESESVLDRYPRFHDSNWFSRGWTLQELIAPRYFVFLSSSWDVIGTKADLADSLSIHLYIPAVVLRLQESHTKYSIAQRMSWFQNRKTTRPEDEAYCLLGLFSIHMPPLYGEGRNAFRRLQEEIMKQSTDTTLFAWEGGFEFSDSSTKMCQCLLATSPSDFWTSAGVAYAPPPPTPATKAPSNDSIPKRNSENLREDMTFAITPHGIRAYIPIFKYREETFADLYWSTSGGHQIFLSLEHDPSSHASSSHSYRVRQPRSAFQILMSPPPGPSCWTEVLIRHQPPPHRAPGELPNYTISRFIPVNPMELAFNAPIRFPEAQIQQFMVDSRLRYFHIPHDAGCWSEWAVGHFKLPAVYAFTEEPQELLDRTIIIKVGRCQQERGPGEQLRHSALWVTVSFFSNLPFSDLASRVSEASANPRHDCLEDHVLRWPDSSNTASPLDRLQDPVLRPEMCFQKTFKLVSARHYHYPDALYHDLDAVSLSFAPCPLNPERTLVMEASYHSGIPNMARR